MKKLFLVLSLAFSLHVHAGEMFFPDGLNMDIVRDNLGANTWHTIKQLDYLPDDPSTPYGQLVLSTKQTLWMAATLGDPIYPWWCDNLQNMANGVYNSYEALENKCSDHYSMGPQAVIAYLSRMNSKFSGCLNTPRLDVLLSQDVSWTCHGTAREHFIVTPDLNMNIVYDNLGSNSWHALKDFDREPYFSQTPYGAYVSSLKSVIWMAATLGDPVYEGWCQNLRNMTRQTYDNLEAFLNSAGRDRHSCRDLHRAKSSLEFLPRMNAKFHGCLVLEDVEFLERKTRRTMRRNCH